MFKNKDRKRVSATVTVKALSLKDIERAVERIEKALPAEEADSALTAAAYRCAILGAYVMADEIVHGAKGEEEYREMRGDVNRIAELTLAVRALGLEGDGSPDALASILKEVLG